MVELESDYVLYRGMGGNELLAKLLNVDDPLMGVRKAFDDPGWISTAIHRDGAFRTPLRAEILVPKGTKVCPMGFTHDFIREVEFCLPRNTRLKVLAVEWDKERGGWDVVLEVIP